MTNQAKRRRGRPKDTARKKWNFALIVAVLERFQHYRAQHYSRQRSINTLVAELKKYQRMRVPVPDGGLASLLSNQFRREPISYGEVTRILAITQSRPISQRVRVQGRKPGSYKPISLPAAPNAMTAADAKRNVDSRAEWPHYVTGAMQVVPGMVDTIVEDSTSPTGYRYKKVMGWALVVRPLAPSTRKRGRRIEPFGKAMVGGFKKRRVMQHHEIDYLEPEELQPSGLEGYTDLVEKYRPND